MKDKGAEREYQRQHYQLNKDLYKSRAKESRARLRKIRQEYVRSLKESTPCADCEEKFPYYVMDFDHLGDNKEAQISKMISGVSLERIKQEIEKCDIVCANCHRIRTHVRKYGPLVE